MVESQQRIGDDRYGGSFMSGRFDYVRYDDEATNDQELFKARCVDLEKCIDEMLKSPRAKALALTKLEEMYMWIGKAIRDDQISRGGDATHIAERSSE